MIHHRHVAGARNGELFFQIKAWARARGGWMAFDSSTGFRLPDDSVLSLDPVLKQASPGEEGPRGLTALRRKLAAYQRDGARLGWLLIPSERAVEGWGPLETGEQGRRIEAATRLEGDPLFSGLVIDLEPIWAV